MTKYSTEIVKKISEYVETGEYVIKDICEKVGIVESTYYQWYNDEDKTEFSEAIKKAQSEALKRIKLQARASLMKRVKGHSYKEKTVCDKNGTKTVTKEVQPSDTAIIFALKNQDKENFADEQVIEHKGNVQIVRPAGKDEFKEDE